jgi:heme A synthase
VGISQKSIEHGFSAHIALGYVIVVVMLVMLLVAVLGQQQPIRVKMVGGLFLLGILQAILGMASESVPAIGPLHAINALAIYALVGLLAHKTWTEDRRADAAPGAVSTAS